MEQMRTFYTKKHFYFEIWINEYVEDKCADMWCKYYANMAVRFSDKIKINVYGSHGKKLAISTQIPSFLFCEKCHEHSLGFVFYCLICLVQNGKYELHSCSSLMKWLWYLPHFMQILQQQSTTKSMNEPEITKYPSRDCHIALVGSMLFCHKVW